MHSKDSAFPIVVPDYPVELSPPKVELGMDLRTYIATALMQGLVSAPETRGNAYAFAQQAVIHADALIAELNKKG